MQSLMYIGRFGDAIAEPIKLGPLPPRHVSPKEKEELAKSYFKTLEVFAEALSYSSPGAGSRGAELATALSTRIAQARVDLQRRLKILTALGGEIGPLNLHPTVSRLTPVQSIKKCRPIPSDSMSRSKNCPFGDWPL